MNHKQTMKAVVYRSKGCFAIEERPIPQLLDERDAIVKVTCASICSSDIHIKHGAVPKAVEGVIVGHEMVGIVQETGQNVKKFRPGDRVTVNVETFCGECFYCKKGFVNNCQDKNGGWALGCRIDGGQAAYVRVPYADNGLNHIPDNVDDEQALFTGDILATGYWGAKIGDIKENDCVAVIGAGPAGISTMLCARLYGPEKIIAIDTNEKRLALIKDKGIANTVLCPGSKDFYQTFLSLTHGRGSDVVIEAAGGEDTFQMAWQLARPNACVCIVALYEKPQLLPLPDMYGKNLTFKTGGVDASDCDEILRLISRGELDTRCLITHRFPLSSAMEAYDIFETKKEDVMKIALYMDEQ